MAIGQCEVCGNWVDESEYNWDLQLCFDCTCECDRGSIEEECTECGVGICEDCAEEYDGLCIDCFEGRK